MINNHMSSVTLDDGSISVVMAPHTSQSGNKAPTQERLNQLDKARATAIMNRKLRQKERLEAKLRELRALMGDDMNYEQLGRIATKLLAQEETLRAKQSQQTQIVNDNMQRFTDELAKLRRLVERLLPSPSPTPSLVRAQQR